MSADTLWCMIWAAMVGGCLGFFAACILTSHSIYRAHADGYQECCDDVAKGRIFDGVRWKLAEPENNQSEALSKVKAKVEGLKYTGPVPHMHEGYNQLMDGILAEIDTVSTQPITMEVKP